MHSIPRGSGDLEMIGCWYGFRKLMMVRVNNWAYSLWNQINCTWNQYLYQIIKMKICQQTGQCIVTNSDSRWCVTGQKCKEEMITSQACRPLGRNRFWMSSILKRVTELTGWRSDALAEKRVGWMEGGVMLMLAQMTMVIMMMMATVCLGEYRHNMTGSWVTAAS